MVVNGFLIQDKCEKVSSYTSSPVDFFLRRSLIEVFMREINKLSDKMLTFLDYMF